MNSIQILKKENAKMKKLDKGSNQAKLIASLNREVKDQDTVLEALRKVINNDEVADKAIVQSLAKKNEPPKVELVETREELKIKIRKLNARISKFENQEKNNKNEKSQFQDNNLQKAEKIIVEENSFMMKSETNDNLIDQIEYFKQENEELKLNLKAANLLAKRFEDNIKEKNEELNNLKSIQVDFRVMH